jgi:hypothetical protein
MISWATAYTIKILVESAKSNDDIKLNLPISSMLLIAAIADVMMVGIIGMAIASIVVGVE